MGKLAPALAFFLVVAAFFAPPAKALTYREFFVKRVMDTAVLCDTYTVQPGDYVLEVMRLKGQIAYRAFPEFMRIFLALNPAIKNINTIYPGQKLIIPLKIMGPSLADEAPGEPVRLPFLSVWPGGEPEPDKANVSGQAGQESPMYSIPYQVRRGDTVFEIIERHYAPASADERQKALDTFLEANPLIKDKNFIFAGETLYLPVTNEMAGMEALAADAPDLPVQELGSASAFEASSYRVKAGDTVSSLLSQQFGPVGSVSYKQALDAFVSLNPQVKDINRIFAGSLLNLPQALEQEQVFADAQIEPAPAPDELQLPLKAAVRDKPEEIPAIEMPAARPAPAPAAPPEPELPVKLAVRDKPEDIPAIFEPPPAPATPPASVAPLEPELPVKVAVRDKPEEIPAIFEPPPAPATPPAPVAPPELEMPVRAAVRDKPDQIPAIEKPAAKPAPPPAPVAPPEPELPVKAAVRDKPDQIPAIEKPAARPAPAPAPVAPPEPELPVKLAAGEKPRTMPPIAGPRVMPLTVEPAPQTEAADEPIRIIIPDSKEQQAQKAVQIEPAPQAARKEAPPPDRPAAPARPLVIFGQNEKPKKEQAPVPAPAPVVSTQAPPAPTDAPLTRQTAPELSIKADSETRPEKTERKRPLPRPAPKPALEESAPKQEPGKLAAILAAIMEPAPQAIAPEKPLPPALPAPRPLPPPAVQTAVAAEPEPIKEEPLPEKPVPPQPEPAPKPVPPGIGGIGPALKALKIELLDSGTYFFPQEGGPDLALDLSLYPAALLSGEGRVLLYSAKNPPNQKDLATIKHFWKQLALVEVPATAKPVDILCAFLDGAGIAWTREIKAFSVNFATVSISADIFVQPQGRPVLALSWLEKASQATDPAMVSFLGRHNISVLEIVDEKSVSLPEAAPSGIPAPVLAEAPACQDLAAMLFAFAQTPYAGNVPISFPYAGFEVKVLTNMAKLPDGQEIIVDFGNIQGQAKEHLKAIGLTVLTLPAHAQSATLAQTIFAATGATTSEPPVFEAAKRERPAPTSLTLPGLVARWPERPPALITPAPLDGLLGRFLHSVGWQVMVISQPVCN